MTCKPENGSGKWLIAATLAALAVIAWGALFLIAFVHSFEQLIADLVFSSDYLLLVLKIRKELLVLFLQIKSL